MSPKHELPSGIIKRMLLIKDASAREILERAINPRRVVFDEVSFDEKTFQVWNDIDSISCGKKEGKKINATCMLGFKDTSKPMATFERVTNVQTAGLTVTSYLPNIFTQFNASFVKNGGACVGVDKTTRLDKGSGKADHVREIACAALT